MARSIASYIAQVSEAVMEVEQRRQLIAALLKEVEPLARNKLIVVDGEVSQINSLQQLLNTALAEIDALRKVEKREVADQHIGRLNEALDEVEWELVDSIKATLAKKTEQQNEIIQKFQDRFREWPTLVLKLRAALEDAITVRAPVRLRKYEIEGLEAKVLQIQRAFTDGIFDKLSTLLDELDASPAKDPKYLEELREETKIAAGFIRQADLLLLQAPLDSRKLYRYTVLLRTPSEPGTHGINIQEKCTLVVHDREEMTAAIEKITQAVNRGVTRDFQTRRAQTAPPAGEQPVSTPTTPLVAGDNNTKHTAAVSEATTASPGEPSAATGDTTRKAELNLPTGATTNPMFEPLLQTSLNELVKDVGDFMYRIFMSHQLQNYLYESPCSLTITTNDLMLPWELMSYQDKDTAGEDKFLCLERPVARMPMGRHFPRQHHRSVLPGRQLRFLLIYADPKNNLPAAKREVDRIEEKLRENWGAQVDVVKKTGAEVTGRAMNDVLRKGSFDVIHFAGHAFFDKEESDLSGLLLHEEEYFLAQKVPRLLEGRPLVFLNACQSGFTANEDEPQQIEEYMQGKAEGLASAFIYGGATGCVGSLWPIYDEPAADFAVHFYNNVLRGYMIGEALRLARRKIKEDYNNQITWAAYVLYGDPTFRL
jgi:hypothetical protein